MSQNPATVLLRKTVKNAKLARSLKNREPKIVENAKSALVFKASKISQLVTQLLTDFHMMKKPDSKMFMRRSTPRPFEDQSAVEKLSQQADASLFAFGSHNKKRPHNLILGRLFDYQLLDMIELGVEEKSFKPMKEFSGQRGVTVQPGARPCFIFVGAAFDVDEDFKLVKNLFVDFFRGQVVSEANLSTLNHVVVCTAKDRHIFFRHYCIKLKKSGTKLPRVELEEMGPHADFVLRRCQAANEDLKKQALRQPKTDGQKSKKKNIESGQFGDKMGRVHMQRQDLDKLQLRKMKGLKRKAGEEDTGSDDDSDGDGDANEQQMSSEVQVFSAGAADANGDAGGDAEADEPPKTRRRKTKK